MTETKQKIPSPRKKIKVTGGATVAYKKGGDGGGGKKMMTMTATMPKRGKGKDGGDVHKTMDGAQMRDADGLASGLVAAVDDIEQGGVNAEQVVSPLFMI
jgi:hypothetical protein